MGRRKDVAGNPAVGEAPAREGEPKRPAPTQPPAEDRFRSLAEHSLEFIGMCDMEFRPFYVNPAGIRMVGLDSVEEACAVRVQDFFFPEDQRLITEEFFPQVLKDGQGEVEIRFRHFKTGEALWMIYNVFQLRDAQGQPCGYSTVSRDITARKQAEEAVRQSEEKFRRVFDSSMLGVAFWRADGSLTEANQAFADLIGYSPEEVRAGQVRWSDVTPPEMLERDRQGIEELNATGVCTPYEKVFMRRDGSRRTIIVGGAMLGGKRNEGVAFAVDITERKRAEQERERLFREVERERASLQAVLEALPVGVWVADASGKMVLVNEAAAEIFGGHAPALEEISQYGFYQVWWPGTNEPVRIEDFPLVRALRGEVVRDMVMERKLADGSRGSHVTSANPIRDAAGNIVGAVVIAMDITSQKRAEAVLRDNQERQSYLLKLADGLRRLTDPVQVQEAAARILAEHLHVARVLYFEVRDPDYVVERDYAKGVPPLHGRYPIAAFGPKLLEDYRAGRTVVVKEVRTEQSLSPSDRQGYLSIQIEAHVGVPLVKEGRLVAGLAVHSGAAREWTAQEVRLIEETAERTWSAVRRARAEGALRESEENYRTLFTSIDEGFCVIAMLFDKQGKPNDWRFVEVNPAFERHNGLVKATGKRIREITPGIEAKWFEIYGKVALTGEAIRIVESSEALNRWFDLYAFRVGNPDEHKVAVLFTDITLRKKAEAELARYREELEHLVAERTTRLQELVAELEHFSYTITHDLKSPLRAMRGFAEMAREACQESGVTHATEFLDRIETSAERMDRLIADALNYSRSVRQELPLEDVDAGALLRGMLDSYPELQPSKAGIRVEGRLPVVLANEAGLTQVFSNLLGNAVKFVKAGAKPQIKVWAEVGGEAAGLGDKHKPGRGWVRIWVEDNGIGISKEMLPRVFDMFSRATKSYEGTGIGLALVRKVVQRMGGKVGVESEEGRGSRFWFELKGGQEKQSAVSLAHPAGREHAANEGTVLYVEDEESDAVFMGRAFAQKGMVAKLQVVTDGRAAIEYLSGSGKYGDREKHPLPALVLLDLNLPQMSGFDVLAWMRNNPDYARMPVVIFSSSTRADDRLKAEQLGANEFVAKPSSGLEFGRVVEALQAKWLVSR